MNEIDNAKNYFNYAKAMAATPISQDNYLPHFVYWQAVCTGLISLADAIAKINDKLDQQAAHPPTHGIGAAQLGNIRAKTF